jgi:hypothetical protein
MAKQRQKRNNNKKKGDASSPRRGKGSKRPNAPRTPENKPNVSNIVPPSDNKSPPKKQQKQLHPSTYSTHNLELEYGVFDHVDYGRIVATRDDDKLALFMKQLCLKLMTLYQASWYHAL